MQFNVVSPIAIDFGAANTGVNISHLSDNNIIKEGFTIIDDGKSIKWLQKERTQNRHQRRSIKRNKLAKRLLWQILTEEFKINNVEDDLCDFINGLLNRRGYTYFTDDQVDYEVFDDIYLSGLSESVLPILDEIEGTSFQEKIINITSDIDKCKKINQQFSESHVKEEGKRTKKFQRFFDELKCDSKDEKDTYSKIFTEMEKLVSSTIKSKEDGHYYRASYFENIYEDIKNNEKLLRFLSKSNVSADEFYKLLANISNFQLKLLRKYFNENSKWDPKKLNNILDKWVKSWRCPPNSKEADAKKLLLDSLKTKRNIIDFLTETDPNKTIPPYEDQDNRKPPRDKTLYIDPVKIDKIFPSWRAAVKNILKHSENKNLTEKLDEVISAATFLDINGNKRQNLDHDALVLQRFFDRAKEFDPYKIRILATYNEDKTLNFLQHYDLLKNHLNGNKEYADNLLNIAQRYYEEVEKAKKGLWSSRAGNILFVYDQKNSKKKNLINYNLSNILGVDFNDEKLKKFHEFISINEVSSGLKGKKARKIIKWAESAAILQKRLGNALNYHILDIERKGAYSKNLSKEEKNIYAVILGCLNSAEKIAKEFKIIKSDHFSSIYSFAQIFNSIEGDIHGFSSISKASMIENSWRSKTNKIEINGITKYHANAVRLPKDSVRPFDGMLDRIIKRQAFEIACSKIDQIEKNVIDKREKIFIPIVIEQNNFAFTYDLATIKQDNKKKKNSEGEYKRLSSEYYNKYERLKNSSGNICPYSGDYIRNGDIDHIIPRSITRKFSSTVYNHEANLIYCTTSGNVKKGNSRYTLKNLNKKYLQNQFGTDNIKQIADQVTEKLENIPGRKREFFSGLDNEEQKVIRHALFIPELDYITFPILSTQTKARVNGTQAWLCKNIKQIIEDELSKKGYNIEFDIVKVKSEDVHRNRFLLGEHDSRFKKPVNISQSPVSHVLDASIALADAFNAELSSESAEEDNVDYIKKFIPDNFEIKKLGKKKIWDKNKPQSEKLFKDTLYGINFLPILYTNKEEVYIGFSLDNSVEIKDSSSFFDLMLPFLKYKKQTFNNRNELRKLLEGRKFLPLNIDKDVAMEHLHYVSKNSVSAKDNEIANVLDALFFTTLKKDIKNVLSDSSSKLKFDKIKEKDFQIKVEKIGKFKKKGNSITHPSYQEWLQVVKTTKELLDKGLENNDTEFWSEVVKNSGLFKRYKPDRNHKKVRKQFSLPLLEAPSGGYRIKQQAGNGNNVWQIVAIQNYSSIGFYKKENGDIDFNNPAGVQHFRKSPNVSKIGGRYSLENEYVPFGSVRNVDLEIGLPCNYSVYLKLAETGRVDIGLTLNKEDFVEYVLPGLETEETDYLKIPSFLKTRDNFVKSDNNTNGIFPGYMKPRSQINILEIGEEVTIEYRTEGFTNVLKEAFNKGKEV